MRRASEARRKERFEHPNAAQRRIGFETLDRPLNLATNGVNEGHGVMHLDGMTLADRPSDWSAPRAISTDARAVDEEPAAMGQSSEVRVTRPRFRIMRG